LIIVVQQNRQKDTPLLKHGSVCHFCILYQASNSD